MASLKHFRKASPFHVFRRRDIVSDEQLLYRRRFVVFAFTQKGECGAQSVPAEDLGPDAALKAPELRQAAAKAYLLYRFVARPELRFGNNDRSTDVKWS